MQSDVQLNSTIGEDSYFGGRFLVKGNMRIDGTFEGKALPVSYTHLTLPTIYSV